MRQFIKILLIAAVLGLIAFFWLGSQVTTVEKVNTDMASFRFRAVVNQFEDPTPLLSTDGAGHVTRRWRTPSGLIPVVPTDLIVLAWRGPEVGLVEARIPLWFLRLKGPAINLLLRDTNYDLDALGMTVEEIQAWGPGIVLDHHPRSGERVLIWTE